MFNKRNLIVFLLIFMLIISYVNINRVFADTEAGIGVGLAVFFPYSHIEVRHYLQQDLTLSGFASFLNLKGEITFWESSSEYNIMIINSGGEFRKHFRQNSFVSPHVGAGAGILSFISDNDINIQPWVWLNSGLSLSLTETIKMDFEINPVYNFEENDFILFPVAKLRWLIF